MDAPLSLKGAQTSPASKRGVRKKGPGLFPLASAFWREGMVMDGPNEIGLYLVKYDDAPARWTDLRHVSTHTHSRADTARVMCVS